MRDQPDLTENTATIPDGIYTIWPEGAGWISYHIQGGKPVAIVGEWEHESHRAANHPLQHVRPTDEDIPIEDNELHLAVLRAIDWELADPSLAVITYRPNL